MTFDTDINKYEVYAQIAPTTAYTFGYGFVYTDRKIYPNIEKDKCNMCVSIPKDDTYA